MIIHYSFTTFKYVGMLLLINFSLMLITLLGAYQVQQPQNITVPCVRSN